MGSRPRGCSSGRGGGDSHINTSLSSSSTRVGSRCTGDWSTVSRCRAIMDRRCEAIMVNSWLLGKLSHRGLNVATDWHSSFSRSEDGIS